ncbi:unnamed protein product, partial [Allacma fusca]
IKKTPSLMF